MHIRSLALECHLVIDRASAIINDVYIHDRHGQEWILRVTRVKMTQSTLGTRRP